MLTQLLINGLIAGAIYALVASGFSLIFSTNKFMHIAHGGSVAVSGYLLYAFFSQLSLPFAVAVLCTLVGASLFGLLMYRGIYLPLQKKNASNIILLVASLALLILIQNALQMIFDARVRTIGFLSTQEGMNVLGAYITPLQVFIILSSIALFVVLHLFMRKSKLGRDMRAVSDNTELASIVGINHRRIADYSFLIGSFLAGIAGILIALEQNIEPLMGTALIIRGFTGAIIGGIGSVPGAVAGSFLLGIIENLGIWYLPSGYKDAIAFALLFVFLLFRPHGLFGIDKGIKQ